VPDDIVGGWRHTCVMLSHLDQRPTAMVRSMFLGWDQRERVGQYHWLEFQLLLLPQGSVDQDEDNSLFSGTFFYDALFWLEFGLLFRLLFLAWPDWMDEIGGGIVSRF
jgi:hypothetical protein